MVSLKAVVVISTVFVVDAQNRGRQGECIGSRFHNVDYDMSDETDENGMPTSFTIEVTPVPEESEEKCLPPNGAGTKKAVCVGINTKDCKEAAEVVKITDNLDCDQCYMGLTTDIFYNLTVENSRLRDVSVGIKDTHLRGASVLHFHGAAGGQIAQGSIPILSREVKANIFFMVGIIPVNIDFRVPMELDYAVQLSEDLDIRFGGELDINLGDHYLSWTQEQGFGPTNTDTSVTWTPVFDAAGKVSADIPLSIKSSLEVEFEHVLSWRLNLIPGFQPLHVEVKKPWFSNEQICLSADADFLVNHDADLHFDFLGYHKTFATFGPWEIYHNHWNSVFDTCIDLPVEEQKALVV
jgi:hypothetical protein